MVNGSIPAGVNLFWTAIYCHAFSTLEKLYFVYDKNYFPLMAGISSFYQYNSDKNNRKL